ncbi:MAG TPA: DEAD/DEAH box helicase [Acidiferrobacteraceae bacterium]|nr:DEAD/DEAH box helicase [Acidiferrobacteraceae bacterium]
MLPFGGLLHFTDVFFPMTLTAARYNELSTDTQKVALASALLWTFRSRTDFYHLLALMGLTNEKGQAFTQEAVKNALADLRERHLLVEQPSRPGMLRLVDPLRALLYRQMLETLPASTLPELIERLDHLELARQGYYWPSGNYAATVAFVRARLFSGADAAEMDRIRHIIGRSMEWEAVIVEAALVGFDAASFERMNSSWRWQLAALAVDQVCSFWTAAALPVVEWALEQLQTAPAAVPEALRLLLAQFLMQRGEPDAALQALDGMYEGLSQGVRAGVAILGGRWAEGARAFELALKQRQAETRARKRLFPAAVAWLYPLALMGQGGSGAIEMARRFCAGEAGKKRPSPYHGWGRWVHALDVRVGEVPADRGAFMLYPHSSERYRLDDLWTLLLAAWLGPEVAGVGQQPAGLQGPPWHQMVQELAAVLEACGLQALLALVRQAASALAGEVPAAGSFFGGPREPWRDVLAALAALDVPEPVADTGRRSDRLLWALKIDEEGALEDLYPLEQKHSQRGWSKPRPLSLGRLMRAEDWPPCDRAVLACIRADPHYSGRYVLDKALALQALIGHPAVVLADAPERCIELVEGRPTLEVERAGAQLTMRIDPPLRHLRHGEERLCRDHAQRRDLEALRLVTLLHESPQRVRVVRFTPEQKRAAHLVAGTFAAPIAAQEEIGKALKALARHFEVHGDTGGDVRCIPADAGVRAELAPAGEGVSLRLVVAPLGASGPRLAPGRGRSRLLAVVDGEAVVTERDLAAEREALERVVEALPGLERDTSGHEWILGDPEQALGLVEILPNTPGVTAVDWPRGQKVRVVTLDNRHMDVSVSRDRNWFRVAARAVDQGLMLELDQLLDAVREKSRFVPMGEGVYVALTRALRQKLQDLAAVLETDTHGSRVPAFAAAWLDAVVDGMALEDPADFRAEIERLQQAQQLEPVLPSGLQAELRSYQEDGYRWAVRLAAAGLGGVLADDMGLGKTLQALAVLLERASKGPALIVAPTSVCGNWLAETLRFAPSLQPAVYGAIDEDLRAERVAQAGAHELLIVSYTLLQGAQERFSDRRWATVIVDEAQAIKNAAAKRSQAVFDLPADFRLALSGTPVENRLSELWSIMNFANPGLLGTQRRFNERFAGPIERARDRAAQQTLRRLVGPFILRRTKSQVLQELPPRTELVLAVTQENVEAAYYESLRREAVAATQQVLAAGAGPQARFNILAQITRLRRAACDPRLTRPDWTLPGAKVQVFAALAEELAAGGHRALVFSQFVDFLKLLRTPLDELGITYQYLDGSTPAAERSRKVQAFQEGDGTVFLISLKAGGFGLNLTAADYVVITDPWWNPAAEDQAMGRAHRMGQLRPVTVYRLVTKDTVEEIIVDLHRDKRALADSILADADLATLPSTEDLVALIRGAPVSVNGAEADFQEPV